MPTYTILTILFSIQILSAQSTVVGKVEYIHREAYQKNQLRDTLSWLYFSNFQSAYHVGRARAEGVIVNPYSSQEIPITKFDFLYPYCFKDIKAGWVRYFVRVEAGNSALLAEDTLKGIDWRLFDETKQFERYLCQKATGRFGGRDYEVWFAPELPVATGPYKLWGLPGLILEARSLDGQVAFLFKSLEISPDFAKELTPPDDAVIVRGGAKRIAEEEQKREDAKIKEILARYPNGSYTPMQTTRSRPLQIELTVD